MAHRATQAHGTSRGETKGRDMSANVERDQYAERCQALRNADAMLSMSCVARESGRHALSARALTLAGGWRRKAAGLRREPVLVWSD
jgi:hypothetical protein